MRQHLKNRKKNYNSTFFSWVIATPFKRGEDCIKQIVIDWSSQAQSKAT
jgi:hypothetical protein